MPTDAPFHPERLANGLEWVPFAVHEKPYCLWGVDIRRENLGFLEAYRPGYFEYLAQVHRPELEGERRQLAAAALHTAYDNALETMFALAGATLQAPLAIPAWLRLYREDDLRQIVEKLSRGRSILARLDLTSWSWPGFSNAALSFLSLAEEGKADAIRDGFGRLWQQCARDFLDAARHQEYTSLKHGFRLSPMGSSIRMGRQDSPDVPAPPERMFTIASSEFGSAYVHCESVGRSKRHLRLSRVNRSWAPATFALRLELIGMAIENTVGLARVLSGADVKAVKFVWPSPLGVFEHAIAPEPGAFSSSFSPQITLGHIADFTAEQIIRTYQSEPEEDSTEAGQEGISHPEEPTS